MTALTTARARMVTMTLWLCLLTQCGEDESVPAAGDTDSANATDTGPSAASGDRDSAADTAEIGSSTEASAASGTEPASDTDADSATFATSSDEASDREDASDTHVSDAPSSDTDAAPDTVAEPVDTEPTASDSDTATADTATAEDTGTEQSTFLHEETDTDSPIPGDGGIDAQGMDTESDGSAPSPGAWPSGKYISIDEVHERLTAEDPDMLLINVVDEEFYNLGHIEGSLIIPWDTLEANLDLVDAAKHVVIYCRRGVRSESAYDTLMRNGFALVWVMEGGLEEWTAMGYPTVE